MQTKLYTLVAATVLALPSGLSAQEVCERHQMCDSGRHFVASTALTIGLDWATDMDATDTRWIVLGAGIGKEIVDGPSRDMVFDLVADGLAWWLAPKIEEMF